MATAPEDHDEFDDETRRIFEATIDFFEGKGKEFYEGYKKTYAAEPEGYAVYGYEAARVALASLAVLLAEDENLVRAGQAVLGMGPKFVVIKKGEHGAMFFSEHERYVLPAYPTPRVVDPTGAGDSFAGGMMGHLAEPIRLMRDMERMGVQCTTRAEHTGS